MIASDILYLTNIIFLLMNMFSRKVKNSAPRFFIIFEAGKSRKESGSLKINWGLKPCDQLQDEIQKLKRDFRAEILYDLTGKSQFHLLW